MDPRELVTVTYYGLAENFAKKIYLVLPDAYFFLLIGLLTFLLKLLLTTYNLNNGQNAV